MVTAVAASTWFMSRVGMPNDIIRSRIGLQVVSGLQFLVKASIVHPVILYDAECGLCDCSVRFILKRDRAAVFRFAALGTPVAISLAPGVAADSVVLVDQGGVHMKSEAAMRIAAQLGFPWSCSVIGRLVPRRWRDVVYDFVASRRYKWFGTAEACELPEPAWRERFL